MNAQTIENNFTHSGYMIVKNFCEPETAFLLARSLEEVRNRQIKKSGNYFRDNTIREAFSCHGHFDFALHFWKEKIGALMGEGPITPINSYARIYEPGAKLVPHLDRPELELSATICLKPDRVPWKFGVVDLHGNRITVEQEAGDAFFYQGRLLHWREGEFQGESHTQLFLHYRRPGSKGASRRLPFVTLNTNQVSHTELLGEILKRKDGFSPSLVYGKTGTAHQPAQRNSLTLSQKNLPLLARQLEDIVLEEMQKLRRLLELTDFQIGKSEMSCVSFGDGSYFDKHADATPKGSPKRRLSWVYYFHREPKQFTGGELILYPGTKKEIAISPQPGLLVAFRSDTIHEVRKVQLPTGAFADCRFTITGFISEAESPGSALWGRLRRIWRALPIPRETRKFANRIRKKVRGGSGKI